MRRVHVVEQEFTALTQAAGWLDQSDRSRLCLLGADRARFLHGQVTNDINGLGEFTGCYAALVNAKGKMESDLFAYRLADEILLDFEPDLTATVQARLERYVIAEDVEILHSSHSQKGNVRSRWVAICCSQCAQVHQGRRQCCPLCQMCSGSPVRQ